MAEATVKTFQIDLDSGHSPIDIAETPKIEDQIKAEAAEEKEEGGAEIDSKEEDESGDEAEVGQTEDSGKKDEKSEEAESDKKEDSEEEEDNSEGSEDEQEVETENFAYYLAKQMAVEGNLDSEFEVKEDITFSEIKNQFTKDNQDRLYTQIIEQVQQQLQQAGVRQETLMYARAIENGMDINQLSLVGMHKKFADVEGQEDVSEAILRESVKLMHKTRGFSDEEDAALWDAAQATESTEKLVKTATEFHKNKYSDFQKEEKSRNELISQKRIAAQQQEQLAITKAVQEKVILGQRITDEAASSLMNDIYRKDQTLKIEGKDYPVSEMQRFLYEMENNPEVKLLAFLTYKYREDVQEMATSAAKAKMEEDFAKSYISKKKATKATKPTKAKKSKKNTVKEEPSPATTVRTIELNLNR